MTREQTIIIESFQEKIKEALRQFGEYTFEDKGAEEVMDLDECIQELEPFTPLEKAEILEQTLESPMGDRFVEGMLMRLQDLPDEDFQILMSFDKLQELY